MINKDTFLAAFDARERHGLTGPAWLRERRRQGIARFAERGLPTSRDEDWKYTSVAPMTATTFDLAPDGDGPEPSEEAIAPFCMGSPSWSQDQRPPSAAQASPPWSALRAFFSPSVIISRVAGCAIAAQAPGGT